jgi:hypothetical protein
MRAHLDIIEDIFNKLENSNLIYELRSLRNEVSQNYTFTELVGETGSMLLKMKEKPEVQKAIGQLISEFIEFSKANGITLNQLVENNEWGKNWNALNDILIGGFIKTEYGEPLKLIWLNSEMSRSRLEDFDDIVILIKEHNHIDLELK